MAPKKHLLFKKLLVIMELLLFTLKNFWKLLMNL